MGGLPLVDVHAHLDQVGNPTASLQDAKASGVAGVVAVGMDVESNQKRPSTLRGNSLGTSTQPWVTTPGRSMKKMWRDPCLLFENISKNVWPLERSGWTTR